MAEIIVDWGSTNFRAFLISDGLIADRRVANGQGVLQLHSELLGSTDRHEFYSAILKTHLGDWLIQNAASTVFMCGAIGSREGWVNTGYIEAPANLEKLTQNLRFLTPAESGSLGGANLCILPGLAISQNNGRHDMMRSEEIKSLGALYHLNLDDGIFCIPGTHCKWVTIRNREVIDFHSVMTGEIYNIMQNSGSLAPLFSEEPTDSDIESFDRGLALASENQDLLADIWQVRSHKLWGGNSPLHLQSYFSGILIGHELRQAKSLIKSPQSVILLSDPGIRQDFYKRAIENAGWGISHIVENEAAACTGMRQLIDLYKRS